MSVDEQRNVLTMKHFPPCSLPSGEHWSFTHTYPGPLTHSNAEAVTHTTPVVFVLLTGLSGEIPLNMKPRDGK